MDPFKEQEAREVAQLNGLIKKHMEGEELQIVNCRYVIPDYANRGHTGLSVEHVHKVAQSMAKKFRKRTITVIYKY